MNDNVWNYNKQLNRSDKYLNIISNRKNRSIPLSSVRYVESRGRKLILHLTVGNMEFYAKLSDLEDVFSSAGLVRTHQSFMVRKVLIQDMSRQFIVCDGEEIPVSRKYFRIIRDMVRDMNKM